MWTRFRSLAPVAAVPAAVAAVLAAAGLPPLPLAFLVGLAAALALALRPAAADRPPAPGAAQAPAEAPPAAAAAAPAPRPAEPVVARALLERLPPPILLVEPGGRTGFANAAAREWFPRWTEGQHYAHLVRAPAFVDAVGAALATGAAQVAEFSLFRGQEFHLRAHVAPTGSGPGSGGAGPLLVLFEDRTGGRRIDALRSDFVANASHELRTPLAALIGYIETLQGAARDDAAARTRFLEIMGRQAERMKRLVDDLMSLNQIEMNEHVPPRGLCTVEEVVREAAGALAPLAERKGVSFGLALGEAETRIRGDRDQLVQVFVNLIDNALKYGAGGGTVGIFTAEPDARHPGMIGITVEDRGPGIPREHVPRLTERFYRVSPQASRDKGGTGLGLAIVKHVLNRHRGMLQIESEVGRGSRFTVWLPQPARSPEPPASDRAETPADRHAAVPAPAPAPAPAAMPAAAKGPAATPAAP